MEPIGKPKRGLFRKYVVIFVVLVGGALLTSALVELFFSYKDKREALADIHRERAMSAAVAIKRFIDHIERQVRVAANTPQPVSIAGLTLRRMDYLRILKHVPAITDISYLDRAGKEQIRVSRISTDSIASQVDYSGKPKFKDTKAQKIYFSTVYFRNESEPYMTIAVAEQGVEAGVVVAEVNLKFIWEVVSQIRVGKAGRAYAVDSSGILVAHPNISLVLKKTDFSSLSQVQAALAASPHLSKDKKVIIAQDIQGLNVLTTFQPIAPLGWRVFVEQPLREAFAPFHSSVWRTALFILFGLGLAVLTSLLLARKMVTPVRALQDGAARIGAGALDQRIIVNTGDELEALAEEFNRMTVQLRDSYDNLEKKVAALQKSNMVKDQFLSVMSHELRTPLSIIMGHAAMANEGMLGDATQKQKVSLKKILSSAEELLTMVNGIMEVTKLEAEETKVERIEFGLGEFLGSLKLSYNFPLDKEFTLTWDYPSNLPVIRTDRRKLRQSLQNLINNAIKFTDKGSVTISAQYLPETASMEFKVADTGIGIEKEAFPLIFEKFRQLDSSNTRSHGGAGLGLYIVKQFTEMLGGTVRVESEPGKGSTFMITVPTELVDDQNRTEDRTISEQKSVI